MTPFSFSSGGDKAAADLEREISNFVESGMAKKQADITNIEQSHRDWVYDEQGQPTPEGVAAGQYIKDLAIAGVLSQEQRWEWATIAVERDLLRKLVGLYNGNQQRGAYELGAPSESPTVENEVLSAKQPAEPHTWTVQIHTTKEGARGRIIRVGPFSAWIPEGDTNKAEACVTAITEVFRKSICNDLVKAICSECVQ